MTPDQIPGAFAALWCALYAAHQVGDHWVQTDHDARHKGSSGRAGRVACARHVLTLTITKLIAVGAVIWGTGLHLHPAQLGAALALDAGSHYWADRRTTLAALAARLPGSRDVFWALGSPRPGHDDNPTIGTGAYALDQSWHVAWLTAAAFIAVL